MVLYQNKVNTVDNLEFLFNRLHELFEYDNGVLIRKININGQAKKGQVAGNLNKSTGYMDVRVDNKNYRQHRMIFLMFHGYLPNVVDHIDGNPLNNKVENLREATKMQNRWNCKPNRGTISGVKGVYKDHSKWKALINVGGVRYYLGMFETIEEAKSVVELKYAELQDEYSYKGV